MNKQRYLLDHTISSSRIRRASTDSSSKAFTHLLARARGTVNEAIPKAMRALEVFVPVDALCVQGGRLQEAKLALARSLEEASNQ